MRISDDPMLLQDLMSETALAKRIKAERERRGLSQERLAEQVEAVLGGGFPQSAVSKIEKTSGRRAITVDEALAISKVLQIPLTELLLPEGASIQQRVLRLLRAFVDADAQLDNAYVAKTKVMGQIGDELRADPDLAHRFVTVAAIGGTTGEFVAAFLREFGYEVEVGTDGDVTVLAPAEEPSDE